MIILNENRQFERVNNKFCDFSGYSDVELKNLTPLDISFVEDAEKTSVMINNMMEGERKDKNKKLKNIKINQKISSSIRIIYANADKEVVSAKKNS